MERGEEVLREFLHPDPYIGARPSQVQLPCTFAGMFRVVHARQQKVCPCFPCVSYVLFTCTLTVEEIPWTTRWSQPRSD